MFMQVQDKRVMAVPELDLDLVKATVSGLMTNAARRGGQIVA